jgi:antitoxin (DNA-binding transcriptional repressor) of toxin-antitoxin stability system
MSCEEAAMETVSMVEFRRHADAIIRKVGRGNTLILTRRGKPVMSLEPIDRSEPDRMIRSIPLLSWPSRTADP